MDGNRFCESGGPFQDPFSVKSRGDERLHPLVADLDAEDLPGQHHVMGFREDLVETGAIARRRTTVDDGFHKDRLKVRRMEHAMGVVWHKGPGVENLLIQAVDPRWKRAL